MAKTPKTRQERYEASGKRPGAPVSTRLSDAQLAQLDAKLGEGESRAAFVKSAILKAIGWNEPAKPPRPTKPRKR